MTSRRFPGTELTEWRSRILDRHPRLFPDAEPIRTDDGWALSSAGWPAIPDGWRRVIEDLCRAIEQAVADEPAGEVVVYDMKEKYGSLQLHVSTAGLSGPAEDAVRLAVDLAEARSGHVCQVCGQTGRLWDNHGWFATLCDRHGEGRPVPDGSDAGIEVTTRIVAGGVMQTARRYDPDHHRFIAVPVPEDEKE